MQVVRAPGARPDVQVAHLLASELAGLICLLATASDPLSLSLGAPAARRCRPGPQSRAGGLPGGWGSRAARAARAGARRAVHVRRVAGGRGARRPANPTLNLPFPAAPTPAPRAGMDLLEEVLGSGDRRRVARLAAREGVLGALARTLHTRGLGGKAAPLLAALAADAALADALRALLGPGDYAALAAVALQEARAGDAAAAAAGLLGQLLAGAGAAALRLLILGRCLGACGAAVPAQAPALAALASSDAGAPAPRPLPPTLSLTLYPALRGSARWARAAGLLVLENLPAGAAAEAGIAAAQLLQHAAPAAAAVLLRPGVLTALLASVADELAAAEPSSDARAPPLAPPRQRRARRARGAQRARARRLGSDRGAGARAAEPARARACAGIAIVRRRGAAPGACLVTVGTRLSPRPSTACRV